MSVEGFKPELLAVKVKAMLVALHFNPVSKKVSKWAEFWTSVASRLASLFELILGDTTLQRNDYISELSSAQNPAAKLNKR